ncbi:MAG: tRNA pseudouridine(38-40) synthase TruA [Phycisphaerae bacterium]
MTAEIRNIKLTIAYQGTRYSGWQRQKDTPTVQETIEETLSDIVGHQTKIQGASRTDAGVHAEGQVANFLVESCPIPTEAFAAILSGKLPPDIAVRESVEVPLNFHASGTAIHKTYIYRIYTGHPKDVQLYNLRWQVEYPLDLNAINAAAKFLIGTHDFQGFTSAKDTRENAVRSIMNAHAWWSADASELLFMIQANRFLYMMVRNIVGTLVEIGRNRWPAEKVAQIIASQDRTQAGPTAPPHGLCLKVVEYLKNSASTLDTQARIGDK